MRNVHVISRSVGFGRSAISVAVFDEIHYDFCACVEACVCYRQNADSLPLTMMVGLGRRVKLGQ